jgi:hypothetical protein
MDAEVSLLQDLIREAVAAGFYNIDIDASPLFDPSQPTQELRHRHNVEATAFLSHFIRRIEPEGVVISIGAEVGEVGGSNTTVDDLRAFMETYEGRRAAFEIGTAGLAKLSVQTGTRHGGIVRPDGSLEDPHVDFGLLAQLGRVAREGYKLGGVVQHGASTLPDEWFRRFPECGAIEIHLSTGFQNLIFCAPEFPADLGEAIDRLVTQAFGDEKEPDDTREQFLYKLRKKAWGPFKRELWDLPPATREPILDRIEERFAFLFRNLGVEGTRETVDRWVKPVEVRPAPLEDFSGSEG